MLVQPIGENDCEQNLVLFVPPGQFYRRMAAQIHEVATEGEVAAFVLHSYRSFHRAFFNDVLQEANAAVLSDRDNVGAVTKEDFFVYSKNNATWGKKRQRASILVPLCGEEALGTAGVLERNMLKRLRGFSREYERLEEAVARYELCPGKSGTEYCLA